jgi:hypothetical protein
MTFKVQAQRCNTCIYRKDLSWNLTTIEDEVRDQHIAAHFKTFRECHHAKQGSGVCCRGFWDHHKDHFDLGQIAQRLGLVEFVEVDVRATKTRC